MPATVVKDKASSGAAVMSGHPSLYHSHSALGCYGCFGLNSLATVQILVGLINIGLGPGRPDYPGSVLFTGAPYLLGTVSIIVGIVTLLARCGYCCLNYLSLIANIICAGFCILGIVLYSMDVGQASFQRMCTSDDCFDLAYVAQNMLMGTDITLIVLISLQVCVNITSALLSVLYPYGRKQQTYQPLVNEVLVINPAV